MRFFKSLASKIHMFFKRGASMDFELIVKHEIRHFFQLDGGIKYIKKRIEAHRNNFYNQSMATMTKCSDLGIVSVGFNTELNVAKFVDSVHPLEEELDKLNKKKCYLKRYLETLNPDERLYLTDKYSNGHNVHGIKQIDVDLYNEITEINDAINFMYGHEEEPYIEPVSMENVNLISNVADITAMLGV